MVGLTSHQACKSYQSLPAAKTKIMFPPRKPFPFRGSVSFLGYFLGGGKKTSTSRCIFLGGGFEWILGPTNLILKRTTWEDSLPTWWFSIRESPPKVPFFFQDLPWKSVSLPPFKKWEKLPF